MPYKIVELNEDELPKFKGKIIQVIDSRYGDVIVGRDYLGCSIKKIYAGINLFNRGRVNYDLLN